MLKAGVSIVLGLIIGFFLYYSIICFVLAQKRKENPQGNLETSWYVIDTLFPIKGTYTNLIFNGVMSLLITLTFCYLLFKTVTNIY